MKTKLLNIVFITFAAIFLVGCRKKENLNANNIVGLGGDTWTKSQLDEWLYTNFTKPYNIEVKYKWDRSELSEIYKNVAPIKEDLVIPVMEAVKKTWIEPYIAIKGENFFKKYCQKQFYLCGSPSYNNNSMTLGIAEGGRKVILLNLNTFNEVQTKNSGLRRIIHTIHHEFGHILHQNIAMDPEYQKITQPDYTTTWFNIKRGLYSSDAEYEADFLGKGFITPYSRSNEEEDFVELLSTLLDNGQAYFDNIINNLFIYDGSYIKRNSQGVYEQNTDARNKLLKKRAMVVSYLKDNWDISLTDLQIKTQAGIESITPTPALHTMLPPEEKKVDIGKIVKYKIYKTITINPQKLPGLSAKFLTAFNAANKAMLGATTPLKPMYIDNISLRFNTPDTMILRVNYFNALLPSIKSTKAEFCYAVSNANGVITTKKYTDVGNMDDDDKIDRDHEMPYSNARLVEQYLLALLAYFNNKQFEVRWVDDIIPQSKGIFGGFVDKKDPSSYLFGTFEDLTYYTIENEDD